MALRVLLTASGGLITVLIALDESAIASDSYDGACLDALEVLLREARSGKHMLLLPPSAASLSSNGALSRAARGAVLSLLSRRSEILGFRKQLPFYVLVAGNANGIPLRVRDGSQLVYRVPLGYFSDSSRAQATALLCENVDDALLFRRLAEVFIFSLKWNVRIASEPHGGGGSTTPDILAALGASGRAVICFVDSDMAHAGMGVGDTASRTLRRSSSIGTLHHVCVLSVREVENLFSVRTWLALGAAGSSLYEAASYLRDAMERYDGDWHRYVDLKRGCYGYEIVRYGAGTPMGVYWSEVWAKLHPADHARCADGSLCDSREECTCCLVRPFGDGLVKAALGACDRLSPQKSAELFQPMKDPLWASHLLMLIAWCCGTSTLVA